MKPSIRRWSRGLPHEHPAEPGAQHTAIAARFLFATAAHRVAEHGHSKKMKARYALLALVALGLLLLWKMRAHRGDQAAVVTPVSSITARALIGDRASAPGVARPLSKPIKAAFVQPSTSTFSPQPGDDRATKQVKRVEAALIQRFLETAPVQEHELGRLMELLLKRSSRLAAPEKAAVDSEIHAMVGDPYFDEIENASRRVNVRLYAIEFIGEALWRGEPLMADQREALNQVIGRVDQSKKADRRKPAKGGAGLSEYDIQVLSAVRDILSPQQFRIFEEVRKEIGLEKEQRSR